MTLGEGRLRLRIVGSNEKGDAPDRVRICKLEELLVGRRNAPELPSSDVATLFVQRMSQTR